MPEYLPSRESVRRTCRFVLGKQLSLLFYLPGTSGFGCSIERCLAGGTVIVASPNWENAWLALELRFRGLGWLYHP